MSQLLKKMLLGYMQASPDGGTPPAPAPAQPATPGTPDETPEEVVNWEGLSSESPGEDDGEVPVVPGTPPETQPPAPAAPASPAPATPAVPAAPPSPAPVPPAAAPAPVPGTPPVAPATPASTPAPAAPQPTAEEQAAQAKAFRDSAVANLSKQYMAEITDEEKQQLLTDPEKVMPTLMAKAVFDGIQIAQRLAHESIMRELPAVQAHQQAIKSAEQNFYQGNPDLAKPEYQSVVVAMAQTARALNPKGSSEEVSKSAAAMARAHLGLPALGAPAPTPAPAAPARPFAPASSSGASPGRAPAAAPGGNPWEELAQDEE